MLRVHSCGKRPFTRRRSAPGLTTRCRLLHTPDDESGQYVRAFISTATSAQFAKAEECGAQPSPEFTGRAIRSVNSRHGQANAVRVDPPISGPQRRCGPARHHDGRKPRVPIDPSPGPGRAGPPRRGIGRSHRGEAGAPCIAGGHHHRALAGHRPPDRSRPGRPKRPECRPLAPRADAAPTARVSAGRVRTAAANRPRRGAVRRQRAAGSGDRAGIRGRAARSRPGPSARCVRPAPAR